MLKTGTKAPAELAPLSSPSTAERLLSNIQRSSHPSPAIRGMFHPQADFLLVAPTWGHVVLRHRWEGGGLKAGCDHREGIHLDSYLKGSRLTALTPGSLERRACGEGLCQLLISELSLGGRCRVDRRGRGTVAVSLASWAFVRAAVNSTI